MMDMKNKVLKLMLLGFLLSGCSTATNTDSNKNDDISKDSDVSESSNSSMREKIKESPDKYTWYIKDYTGRNASQACSWRLGGDCMDDYGDSHVTMVFITEDGSAVTEENISDYVVTGQSVEPNSEQKLVFEKMEDGQESGWIESQTYNEIELEVKKVEKE
ncbi:hypothetical protein [Dubosiella newyorkensis]|uniref:hypothetical protein n=1 Tax=Dubosiella newyorkensis TaxID=1862672 RepID=UPI00272D7274|nr:hypothetical protein [Dubosiella newyorkensis]